MLSHSIHLSCALSCNCEGPCRALGSCQQNPLHITSVTFCPLMSGWLQQKQHGQILWSMCFSLMCIQNAYEQVAQDSRDLSTLFLFRHLALVQTQLCAGQILSLHVLRIHESWKPSTLDYHGDCIAPAVVSESAAHVSSQSLAYCLCQHILVTGCLCWHHILLLCASLLQQP